MKRLLSLTFLMSLLLVPSWAQHVERTPFKQVPSFLGYVSDEFIVVLTDDAQDMMSISHGPGGGASVTVSTLQLIIEHENVKAMRRQFPTAERRAGLPDLSGHYKVKLSSGGNFESAIAAFEADPHVRRVEKIGLHTLSVNPNDPYFQNSPNPNFDYDQWHHWGVGGIESDGAWDRVNADESVVVAILDSGVRYYHTDIGGDSPKWGPGNPFASGNVWINNNETPGDSIDNDGNGYVDDTVGWDFVTEGGDGFFIICLDVDCADADNDADDGNGHGTHVAGSVAALTNNSSSVAGVAGGYGDGTVTSPGNGVKILPLRIAFHAVVFGTVTGVVRMDWAAEALNYVADLVDAGVNVTAVNCSWSASNSGGIDAAIDNVLARDVMVIHAAGNSAADTPDHLGTKPGVMNVAATDTTGAGASFSNFGSWVDVAAPGVQVLSTSHVPSDPDPTHHYIGIKDGTSVSAPLVTGIAALLESCNSSLSGPDKFGLIVNNTNPYSDVRDLGAGIASADKALEAAGCASVVTGVTSPPSATDAFSCAYPNPFNPSTSIFFRLDTPSHVDLSIYDVAGRLVQRVASGDFPVGIHRATFSAVDHSGTSLPSGVYFYKIRGAGITETRKIILLR